MYIYFFRHGLYFMFNTTNGQWIVMLRNVVNHLLVRFKTLSIVVNKEVNKKMSCENYRHIIKYHHIKTMSKIIIDPCHGHNLFSSL